MEMTMKIRSFRNGFDLVWISSPVWPVYIRDQSTWIINENTHERLIN